MSDLTNIKVGDVLVYGDPNNAAQRGEVVKVGRKWLTVRGQYGAGQQYNREDGSLNSPYSGWAQTVDQYETEQREAEVNKALREMGVTCERKVTANQRSAMLELLRGES